MNNVSSATVALVRESQTNTHHYIIVSVLVVSKLHVGLETPPVLATLARGSSDQGLLGSAFCRHLDLVFLETTGLCLLLLQSR